MARYRRVARKAPVVSAPVEKDEVVLADLLKADLVSLAESKGIDSSGTKADLLARLNKS